MIVRAVDAGSPGARAGLLPGDQVTAAGGRPVRHRLDWLAVEANLRPGVPLPLDIRRGASLGQVTLALHRTPARFFATTAGVTLLVARTVQLLTLSLAFVLLLRRSADREARLAALAMAALGVYSIVLPYQIAAVWRSLPIPLGLVLWVPFSVSWCAAAALFTFFAAFPVRLIRSPLAWLAVWTPMAAVVGAQLRFWAPTVYDPRGLAPVPDWSQAAAIVMAGYAAAAAAALLIGYWRTSDLSDRRRIRVMAAGSIVGLLSVATVVSLYWRSGGTALESSVFSSPIYAIGTLLGLALPASFAYAILRQRLFDVGHLVRQGLQYTLARRVLLSIVPLSAAALAADLALHRAAPLADVFRTRAWVYLGLAAMALHAHVRRRQWLDALDRRFFRERHDARRLLRTLADELRDVATVDDAAPLVIARISEALHPEYAALLVKPAGGGSFQPRAAAPAGTAVESLPAEHAVVDVLRALRKPFNRSAEASIARRLGERDAAWLARNRADLIVPVLVARGSAAEALMVLGPKRSEEPYGDEDEDLLATIAVGLSLLMRTANTASGPAPVLTGRYRLERRVGQGGMGVVYAAHDEALDRPVAIKLLRQDFVDPARAQRFTREARAMAALAHPNVATIHDIAVSETGQAFLVMELLEGVTLRDALLRAPRLSPGRARCILRDVCAAVDAAHQRQLLHRDLKPENIFLCRSAGGETAKVLDFGLARAIEAGASGTLTEPGTIGGTPAYIAPEYFRGAEPSTDWDLWSLAVIAFEMLSGVLPCAAPSGPVRLEAVPPSLRAVFASALSRNPIDRPATAQELFDGIDRALSHERHL
jgi:serine/threonine-protein kinase